jgi:hypothetical protein
MAHRTDKNENCIRYEYDFGYGGMFTIGRKLLFYTGTHDGSPELSINQAKEIYKWLGEWIERQEKGAKQMGKPSEPEAT